MELAIQGDRELMAGLTDQELATLDRIIAVMMDNAVARLARENSWPPARTADPRGIEPGTLRPAVEPGNCSPSSLSRSGERFSGLEASSEPAPSARRAAGLAARAERQAELKAANFRWDPVRGLAGAPGSPIRRQERGIDVLLGDGGKSLFPIFATSG